MDQPIIPKDKVGEVGTTDTLADPKTTIKPFLSVRLWIVILVHFMP